MQRDIVHSITFDVRNQTVSVRRNDTVKTLSYSEHMGIFNRAFARCLDATGNGTAEQVVFAGPIFRFYSLETENGKREKARKRMGR